MTIRKRYLLRVDGMDICGRLIGIDDGLLTFDDVRQEFAYIKLLPYHCACSIAPASVPGEPFSYPHVAPDSPEQPTDAHLMIGRPQITAMRENTKETPCT